MGLTHRKVCSVPCAPVKEKGGRNWRLFLVLSVFLTREQPPRETAKGPGFCREARREQCWLRSFQYGKMLFSLV